MFKEVGKISVLYNNIMCLHSRHFCSIENKFSNKADLLIAIINSLYCCKFFYGITFEVILHYFGVSKKYKCKCKIYSCKAASDESRANLSPIWCIYSSRSN
jgi:hypothetical protein